MPLVANNYPAEDSTIALGLLVNRPMRTPLFGKGVATTAPFPYLSQRTLINAVFLIRADQDDCL